MVEFTTGKKQDIFACPNCGSFIGPSQSHCGSCQKKIDQHNCIMFVKNLDPALPKREDLIPDMFQE